MAKSQSSPCGKSAPKKARVSTSNTSDVLATNAARETRVLLDYVTESRNIADVLADVLAKLDSKTPGIIVSRIKAAQEAAVNVYRKGREQATRVSKVPYALKGFDAATAAEKRARAAEGEKEMTSIAKLRAFNRECKDPKAVAVSKVVGKAMAENLGKENRRSSPRAKSPLAEMNTGSEADAFTGMPPEGKQLWTREDIVTALVSYHGAERKNRIVTILKKKKTHFKTDNGIYRMLRKYEVGESPR